MNEFDLTIYQQPHSVKAEEKLIASCLLETNPEVYDSVSSQLSPEDFYTKRCQYLFEAIGALAEQRKPLDEVALTEHLKATGGLDEVGGIAGILNIMNGASTASEAQFLVHTLVEKSKLRKIIRASRLAVEQAESEKFESQTIQSKLEATINDIPNESDKESNIGTSARCIIEELDSIRDGTFQPDVVRTHASRLDNYLGNRGIAAGEVMTVAAPTSCGKSALALFIALQAVKKDGHSCLIFSFEMPQKQLTKRMIQIMSGVNLRSVEEGTASDVQVQRVKDIAKEIETLPIHTSHSVRSADDLFSQTRRYVNKKGVKLVVIDYLQLIPFNSNKMSKNDGIANISHRIKQMALELDIAVILLAQVNREGAKRGALDVYDLKDSGDIENDADVVLVMYPSGGDVESSKDKDYNGPYTNLIYKLAKNREGERGVEDFFKFYHCIGRFL